MPNSFIFTQNAKKIFLKLEQGQQERIRAKLEELKKHEHLVSILKTLTNFDPATHRLRIGDYRIILQKISEKEFLVLDIGHRSDIYK